MAKLTGDAGNNALTGGAQDDIIKGLGGNDTLRGEAGDDLLDGAGGNDALLPGEGDDTVRAGAGDDFINADDTGDDIYDGEGGIDHVAYHFGVADGIIVDLAIVGPQDTGGAGIDTLIAIENLTGSTGDDTLRGTAGVNVITGELGDDFVEGRGGDDVLGQAALGDTAGNDTIFGGDGADLIYAGGDQDLLNGGIGHDAVTFAIVYFSPGHDIARTCSLAVSGFQTVSPGAQVSLNGIEELVGGQLDDTFTGSTGDDVLRGGLSGDDILSGGDGDDTLDGGFGDDQLDGGAGFDMADFSRAPGAASIFLGISFPQNTHWGLDALVSIEGVIGSAFNDSLIGVDSVNRLLGGDGNDVLSGMGGADTLEGGAGKDLITGGGAADRLIGGGGVDIFAFNKTSESSRLSGADLIWDLGAADIIRLTGIDADTTLAGDQAFTFRTTGAGSARLTYNPDTDQTTLALFTDDDRLSDGLIYIRGNHLSHDGFEL